MSLRVVQTPESLADIALQADYYAQRESIALAQRFTDAIKTTVRLLATHPWIGKETDYAHPKLAGISVFPRAKTIRQASHFLPRLRRHPRHRANR